MTPKAASSAVKRYHIQSMGLALALLLVACLPRGAHCYASFAAGSKHDFTNTSGYTGGSVCGECHNAAGGALGDGTRLLVQFSDNSELINAGNQTPTYTCSKTCHIQNATSATINPPLAGDGGWATESTAQTFIFSKPIISSAPPHTVNCTGGQFLACEQCHPRTDYSRCLDCHADTAVVSYFCGQGADSDSDSDLGVSKFIVGMSGAAGLGILSSHNINYSTLPSADMTDPNNNECLKCHGSAAATDHPGRASNGSGAMTPLLYMVDGANDPITPPTTANVSEWNAFNRQKRQTLCLSCHDGLYNSTAGAAEISLGGQQVPPVPRYNYNNSGYASGTPYFANANEGSFATKNYYINNGHGAPLSSRTGTAMNLTCMGETNTRPGDASTDTAPGCHSAHGTKNFSALRDSGTFRTPFDTVPGIDTPEEMSQFCQLCHNRTSFDAGAMRNGFHAGLMNTGQLSHFDSRTSQSSDTFTNGNTVFWRLNNVNMKTGDPAVSEIQPMPFFNSKTAANTLRDGRLHSNSSGPGGDRRHFDTNSGDGSSSSGSVITCVTCHDPHGTFDSMEEVTTDPDENRWYNTFGMLRLPEGVAGDSYTWELCAQCHIK